LQDNEKRAKNELGLVDGAPPGRAAADAVPDQAGAVFGADTFGGPFGHEVAGVGAAAIEEVLHRLAQVAVETAQLVVVQRVGGAAGVEARSP